MSQHTARLLGLVILCGVSGCVYIPTWDWPEPACCQCAEDRWGDAVDCVNHQSTIDQPCHDPEYCKRGVYRVAAPGTIVIAPSAPDSPPAISPGPILAPQPKLQTDDRTGDLKP
jgi:hypothetical protein